MNRFLISLVLLSMGVQAFAQADSLSLQEVVVTGTRNAVDVRYLPMTVTVIGREKLTEQYQPSVLPTVMQQVPSLFVTGRSMMGYGVSNGAAGGINL
ncbi:MAG: TonB-dependent receptor, partial [Prevotellaceae bacterium]|nr:TonB-dependent receptor [Prevotellaceae bacterium]